MDILLAAFIVSAIKGIASSISEYGNYEEDKKAYGIYKEQQNRYIQRQRENLEITKEGTAVSAMSAAVERTLYNLSDSNTVETNQNAYIKRINQYTDQYADQVGSAAALSGISGFRNSGSNMNAYRRASANAGYNLDYLKYNMMASMESEGYSRVQRQIGNMDSMLGYRFNIKNAIKQTNMLIEEAEASKLERNSELGLDGGELGMWKRIGLAFAEGFVGSALDFGTQAVVSKIESTGNGDK